MIQYCSCVAPRHSLSREMPSEARGWKAQLYLVWPQPPVSESLD